MKFLLGVYVMEGGGIGVRSFPASILGQFHPSHVNLWLSVPVYVFLCGDLTNVSGEWTPHCLCFYE